MTNKKIERLGTEKLSGEVSTSKNDLLNELNKISHKMIYILNKRKSHKIEDIEYFNSIGYLSKLQFISPLFYMCELARFLNQEEWEHVFSFWLEDYDFIKDVIKKLGFEIEKELKNGNN